MNAITQWQFSVNGVGAVQVYDHDFAYAGGFVIVGLGGGAGTVFDVYSLGNSEIALSTTRWDQHGNPWTYYWNSHYGVSDDQQKNGGMMLWYSGNYSSNSIGAEQTFRLLNLGHGNVALQATGGAFAGQYLSAMPGGWYPSGSGWGIGTGSFNSSPTPFALQLQGDLLALLQITNSGFETNLQKCDLGPLDLSGANMQGCILSQANLKAVKSLNQADFTGAVLHGAYLGDQNLSTATSWRKADFTGCDLEGIAAHWAELEDAILDNANLEGRNLAGSRLTGASLKGTRLTGADLTGTHLEGADLAGAILNGAILQGAHLDGANLAGAQLGDAILDGAYLDGTHFDHVDLTTAQFDPDPNFTRATTNRTTFVGATVPYSLLRSNWSYLDLTDAHITGLPSAIPGLVADGALLPDGLSLQGTDLTGASFVGTRMYEAQLQNANLESANLRTALLKGAKLNGANLTLANLDSAFLIAEQVASLGPLQQTKLEAAVLTKAFMFNTVLDGAHCDGVDFSGCLFVTASALGAGHASAVGASMNFAKFDDADAVHAVFDGAQLSAASFSTATLVSASFQDNGTIATQLTPSSDTTHTPASLYEADIRGTNFSGANMDGLDMRGAVFSTAAGEFANVYVGYADKKVPVAFTYEATVLGDTTTGTTCPDGSSGPCRLTATAESQAAN